MKLLSRLRFALKYDFDGEFVVWSFPDQTAVRFLSYDDAKTFSDKQIKYRPKIMIEVEKL